MSEFTKSSEATVMENNAILEQESVQESPVSDEQSSEIVIDENSPEFYEPDIIYYGNVLQDQETDDISVKNDNDDYNDNDDFYDYEKEDAEYEAMCKYDDCPRDDYRDDMDN
jgi:hypothetical protein